MADCIAAISTPAASGGVSMVRISGKDAVETAAKVFVPVYPVKKVEEMKGYTAAYGNIVSDGKKLDDGVLLVFRTPHSYTGEDTAEITCHGGIHVTRRVLQAVLSAGARMAQAGEFTKLALLNGKMSLTEAEGVIDLINAGNDQLLSCARAQTDGALYRRIETLSDRIAAIASEIAVWIDYPDESEDEDEISKADWLKSIAEVKEDIDSLIATYDCGVILRDGISAAIVGKPNAGKSTLMNLLAGVQKSIVTDIEGTTRDIVEDTVQLGDILLRLADCAGIRDTSDTVENIGVQRMIERIDTAQLIIAVFDGSRPLCDDDIRLIGLLHEKTVVPVINKSDLETAADTEYIAQQLGEPVIISAKSGDGADRLEQAIKKRCGISRLDASAGFLANERQRQCALSAQAAVDRAYNALACGMTADVAGLELEAALSSLYELSGKTASEEVIDRIFSRFCVGK